MQLVATLPLSPPDTHCSLNNYSGLGVSKKSSQWLQFGSLRAIITPAINVASGDEYWNWKGLLSWRSGVSESTPFIKS